MAKITAANDIALLLSTLRADFPLSKPMWQVVRDTRDGLMEANIFTDDWPHYTTVVSQEFAPRLSQVADIRVHSEGADRVMQVLNDAKLLENTGNWQGIFFVTDSKSDMNKDLVNALSQHQLVKKISLSVSSFKLPFVHLPEGRKNITVPPPPGYLVKSLLPKHAELLADDKVWREQRNWYMDCTSYDQRMEYFKELIQRFGGVGVYKASNPLKPVSWTLRKTGGIHGISFTHPDYRGRNLLMVAVSGLRSRALAKGEVILGETRHSSPKPFEECGGTSYGILLCTIKDTQCAK